MPRGIEPARPAPTRRRRRWAAAGALGRLGAGLLVAPLAVLGGAAPAGGPVTGGLGRTLRLRPINGWDAASLRWLAPTVGRPGPARYPGRAPVAQTRTGAIVRRIFLAGDRIARLPYKWGGGHGSFADSGYDCSGSVSYVLHAAGLLSSPEASSALTGYGEPGPGRRVTVYANSQHALVTVDGRRFDTITLRETGTRWAPRAGTLAGYVMRHPVGL